MNEIYTKDASHFESLSDILFIGGFPHNPNVDAAIFIAHEVMPYVWQERPDVRLVIVGYAPPQQVLALAGPRIVVTGQVPRVEPFLDRARVFLAALRYGAGVKGKTVDALRLGVPVVTTPIGAEGIGIRPGHDAIVAAGAKELAEGVLELLRDPARCAALSFAGADLIRKRFSRTAARITIDKIFLTPRCGICGSGNLIPPPLKEDFREACICRKCFALARTEALGRVILARLAQDGESSLAELSHRRSDLSIHEFGSVGGIVETLRGQPWFTISEYFADIPLGGLGPNGVRCENLINSTFSDDSFNLIISQDVMEHIQDPARAFSEIFRILRPGGSHIFTISQNLSLAQNATQTKFSPDLTTIVNNSGLKFIEHVLPVLGGKSQKMLRIFEAIKPAIDGSSLPHFHAAVLPAEISHISNTEVTPC
jgi:hypothetical protein